MDLDVWIDAGHKPGFVKNVTRHAATWPHGGTSRVHVWLTKGGLRGQWIDTWHYSLLTLNSSLDEEAAKDPLAAEKAIILEDDLAVSRYYWRWLKAAHVYMAPAKDLAGATLERARTCEALCGDMMGGPRMFFAYKLLGTWGFSPKAAHMARFRKWYYSLTPWFKPYLNGTASVHTFWYKEREQRNQERERIWSAHHVKYTDSRVGEKEDAFTLYVRLPGNHTLVRNWREAGLNYGFNGLTDANAAYVKCAGPWDCPRFAMCWPDGYCRDMRGCQTSRIGSGAAQSSGVTAWHRLLTKWEPRFASFPPLEKLPRLGWDGGKNLSLVHNTQEFRPSLVRNPKWVAHKRKVVWDSRVSSHKVVCPELHSSSSSSSSGPGRVNGTLPSPPPPHSVHWTHPVAVAVGRVRESSSSSSKSPSNSTSSRPPT